MSLCKVCDKLDIQNFVDWEKDLEDVRHQPSLSKLEHSALTENCSLCKLILSSIQSNLAEAGEGPIDASIWESSSPIILRGVQYIVDDEDTEPGGLFWIKARCDGAGPFAHAYFSLYLDDEDPDSAPVPEDVVIGKRVRRPEENHELLRGWIRNCEANHNSCVATGPLPTRVINVGEEGDDFVRLEMTDPVTAVPAFQKDNKYMTLSHCWGPTPELVIRTTKATLPQHLTRIPLSDLTNTFRDAVHVTRAVGVKYIWIDSLCIVQDDADDWARESAKMGFIYANSYLTVAAAASPDSRGGCFHHNPPPSQSLPPARIKCTIPSGGKGHVFLRPRLRDFLTLHKAPLHTRAWVKQERILSPRTVHYDADQMLWECREGRVCESGVPESAFVTQRRIWDGRLHFEQHEEGEHGEKRRSFWYDWYDLVESYTTHGLTKGEDKLPALSGLAQTLETASGGSYVAGLWRDHLPFGLLWRKAGEWLKPAPTYRAPTWSWAAWDGRASFYGEVDLEGGHSTKVIPAVEDIEAVVQPLGLDPRGRLASGALHLTGQLKPADERMDPRSPGYRKLAGVMESLNLTVDFLTADGGNTVFGIAFFDEEYRPGEGPVYCLRIARMESALGEALPSLFLALLLRPTGKNRDEYRRIGIGEQREVGVGRLEGPVERQPDFFAGVEMGRVTIV